MNLMMYLYDLGSTESINIMIDENEDTLKQKC